MPVFRPLPRDTLAALTAAKSSTAAAAASVAAAAAGPDASDDDTYVPPCRNPYRRRGADDADELVDGDDDGDECDGAAGDVDVLDELGEWAAGGGRGAANLTARLQPRNNANASHARLVDRMDRAEDRRREHVARDKLDRATVEQVLDPRTRMILFRLLSRARLTSIDGCVSTGKEANVYYGTAPPGCVLEGGRQSGAAGTGAVGAGAADVAVKVFKTAILSFKDRERYVAGEHRFRRGGYNRQSNRKMVQQWTEKEYRNLIRLQEAGVPAPTPLIIKPPVLVMEFFGRDGWPAPRLKDASLSPERLTAAYAEVCILMRRMFCRAKLVHGDLSEYNILYHRRQVIIIDVSQSVEDDHPMALDFLRRDCVNVNDFFSRGGVSPVLGLRELFEFITREEGIDSTAPEARAEEDLRLEDALRAALVAAEGRSDEERAKIAADDYVFNQSFIPRSLDDIYNGDADMHRTTSRDPEARDRYAKLTGNSNGPGDEGRSGAPDGPQSGTSSASSSCPSDDDGDGGSESWDSDVRPTSEECREARKGNKREVKAAARERREKKLPKHVKKRKEAVAKRRRHVKTKK
jgi:RIO kinase 1